MDREEALQLFKRLKSDFFDDNVEDTELAFQEFPGETAAKYNAETETITMDPRLLTLSRDKITHILLHELSHSHIANKYDDHNNSDHGKKWSAKMDVLGQESSPHIMLSNWEVLKVFGLKKFLKTLL